MHIPKNAYKKLSILALVVFMALMLPAAAFAFDCNLTADELNGSKLNVGDSINLTASMEGATAYEFWVRDGKSTDLNGGWTVIQGYSADNTCDYTLAKSGTYVVVAYAKTAADAVESFRSEKLYYMVDSSAAVTSVTYNNDGTITATATSENINEPLFDWWAKAPNGDWKSILGTFTTASTVTFDPAEIFGAPMQGIYTVVANVTDLDFYELLIQENLDLWNQIKPFSAPQEQTVATGLSVVEVSAINATTIEVTFNRAPAAEEALTYTVAGTAYVPVIDGAVATLTVPTMIDDTAYAVVVNDGEADLYNADVTYDINQPDTLTIQTVDMSQTVGEQFTLTVSLVDEDGDAVANKDLTLDVTPSFGVNNEPLTLTATTDVDGNASFSWTRSRADVGETLDVFVNDRPVVRANAIVVWGTALKLVDVDAKMAVDLGFGTEKEYVITAKNANGTDYTGVLSIDYVGTNAIDTNITAEYLNAAGAWTALPDTSAGDANVDGIALTAANTGVAGSITIRLYADATATVISPIFFQDLNADQTLDANEARITGGTINYAAQVPTFTWTAANALTSLANSAVAGSTADQKDYVLTVTDQFGNPYRGAAVILSTVARADGLAATVPSGFERIAVDTDLDDDYATGEPAVAATTQTIDFSIGGDVDAEDGLINVRVTDTNATAEIVQPVAIVDVANTAPTPADVAGVIDANDYSQNADALTFSPRVIESITLTDTDEDAANPAENADKVYEVAFVDQFGDAITPSNDIVFQVLDNAGALTQNVAAAAHTVTVELDAVTPGAGFANGAAANNDGVAGNENFVVDGQVGTSEFAAETSILVGFNSDTADTYTLRVFSDVNNDGNLDGDEVTATQEITVLAQEFGEGTLAVAATNATTYNDADSGDFFGFAATDQAPGGTDDGDITVTYTVTDQSGNAWGTHGALNLKWTVVNNTNKAIDVDGGNALAAGETYTVTNAVLANAGTDTIDVVADDANGNNGYVTITAEIVGIAGKTVTEQVLFYNFASANGTAESYNGTIVAFDKANDILVINTTIGYVAIDYSGADVYQVNGNTLASATTFESFIEMGATINYTDDTTTETIAMTTN